MEIYNLIESLTNELPAQQAGVWTENQISFIYSYIEDKDIMLFDGVPDRDNIFDIDFPAGSWIRHCDCKYYFVSGNDHFSKQKLREIFECREFLLGYVALIPVSLSNEEKITLIDCWNNGDKVASGVEMFVMGEDGDSLKWYNPGDKDTKVLFSKYFKDEKSGFEVNNFQLLENCFTDLPRVNVRDWKNGILSFLYKYIQKRRIAFFFPYRVKESGISERFTEILPFKYYGQKMFLGFLDDGMSLYQLEEILFSWEFESGNVALVPFVPTEDEKQQLAAYWKTDKVYSGVEMFVMGKNGSSIKWYNPKAENATELFSLIFKE